MDPGEITIHDQRITYHNVGSGPVLLLIHGMAGSATTWRQVMPGLAKRFTVIAPDLLGHGRSEKPPGDYSLGAFACTLRDLLVALGHERATPRWWASRSVPASRCSSPTSTPSAPSGSCS